MDVLPTHHPHDRCGRRQCAALLAGAAALACGASPIHAQKFPA